MNWLGPLRANEEASLTNSCQAPTPRPPTAAKSDHACAARNEARLQLPEERCVSSADGKDVRALLQMNIKSPAQVAEQAADSIEIDHDAAMHLDNRCRVEPFTNDLKRGCDQILAVRGGDRSAFSGRAEIADFFSCDKTNLFAVHDTDPPQVPLAAELALSYHLQNCERELLGPKSQKYLHVRDLGVPGHKLSKLAVVFGICGKLHKRPGSASHAKAPITRAQG